ncbi:prolyl aminopeptidase [Micromonospora carbonacea]|uniref:Proline iminopeptidase n=1 Tax=Micromonospora carbonacea TaxID=47853 RepID=A0A7H8XMC1_9ACTN|nr:prolyl aminopeptidase [Micromonospora carbonacea]MBB5826484.1 proline iminopeptidase [Micromonospora carbonacea]QLD26005.1 prolyl aminopeptidase [Micromonospora carbonacea]
MGHPLVEPYDQGMLDVGDGHRVYWEVSGNPDGMPAVAVHGGPGGSSSPGTRRLFDPARYRLVQFDQRGCGRSTPHASDPAADLRHNTTDHLLADMERLREHLGVDRWLLFGNSWGSTLGLAYAQRHPQRVSAIVLVGVTMSRRSEIDWLYRGVGRFFPEQWRRFVDAVPAADRPAIAPGRGPAAELLTAYARLLEHPDAQVRQRAAIAWLTWEDAVVSLEPNGKPDAYRDQPPDDQVAFVRLCAHYFSHGAWLADDALLRDAHRLAGIPGVLVHGRFDLGAPLETPWSLARAWPDAELIVVDDSGHTGSDTMRRHLRAALDRFAPVSPTG